ncbi:magnesium transporter CorA family protein [Listeria cossartiae subsp. cayugensis]|uniref:Magnesium transporter CorA family protein n=1 Tax=Listeria cossartiae subsp. cayugensis TaxID=2713505 RepID=A0ABU2ILX0_9LIST|nr:MULTISPECIES: magnesium transporter CorA family protein [Listeria]MDT0049187.1 magnesium transporter CorA family protein [Listeria cossartiae subsp. cayugensis]MDT0065690.1 magnesium transporter CorA family protein [Listeria cossartiae subsp. cayugensis]MDT0078706.1 magnesium transporter CorA family protein [Listeria cossartiae subsp. cayugensis]MDT0081542.1 magnesium transporter CorA family protein [Listeria cossartiae subsp. cayugensis]MDT0087923.1 magnesium transporter CorA family protei
MSIQTVFGNGKYNWINIDTDNTETLADFYEKYQIDNEVIAYSIDRNERAHFEYDQKTNTFVVVFNVPDQRKLDNHYETIPMVFIIKDEQLITITNNDNQYITRKMKRYLADSDAVTVFQFLFSSLYFVMDAFFPYVEEMDMERRLINDKLKIKTTKKNLLLLSDLETGIVYFVSASKQNAALLEQMKSHMIYRELNEVEKEQFEDALIEAKQLVEMTGLSSEILQQLSGTYNNILNNNLNDTMKILTALSILLTVPTIITGFFGMNMPLPLEHNVFGWLITILISIVLWFGLSFILRKLMR